MLASVEPRLSQISVQCEKISKDEANHSSTSNNQFINEGSLITKFHNFSNISQCKAQSLCGTNVSLVSGWGLEGEEFNVTLTIENVTEQTNFSWSSNWDKLQIDLYHVSLSEDAQVDLKMNSSHFYLYEMNITCRNGMTSGSKIFEVIS